MKITKAEGFTVRNPTPSRGGMYWHLVKLETNESISGWGEVYWNTFGPQAFSATLQDVSRTLLEDHDPFEIETLFSRFFSLHCKQHADLSKLGILSGIEIACWDIIGKAVERPVSDLLGGRCRDRVRTYSYVYPEDPKIWHEPLWYDADACAARALEYAKSGFTAVKIDPVRYERESAPWQPSLAVLENAEAVIRAVRKAVGSRCDIIVGTHGQFTPSAAVRFARRIESFDPLWFEEPTPPERPEALRQVVMGTSIPIATGERLASKFQYVPLLEAGVDILQIDVSGVGGILEAKKISAMAEARHAMITPHSWAGPVSFAAQVQLAVCQPNFLIQEMVDFMGGFYQTIAPRCVDWQDGSVRPSREPGLGIRVDEVEVRRYSVTEVTEEDPLLRVRPTERC